MFRTASVRCLNLPYISAIIFQSYKKDLPLVSTGFACYIYTSEQYLLSWSDIPFAVSVESPWPNSWELLSCVLQNLKFLWYVLLNPHLSQSSSYVLPWSTPFLYPYEYRSITSKCTWHLSSLDSCMGLSSYRLASKLSTISCFHTISLKAFTNKLLNLSGRFEFMWPSFKISKANWTKSTNFSFNRADLTGFYSS